MLKKLFVFGLTIFSLGLFFLTTNTVNAIEIDVTDDPVDEIVIPDDSNENEGEQEITDRDEVVINPNAKPIVSDNSGAQEEIHKQKVEYAYTEDYAEKLWNNNGIVLDIQCYFEGKNNGESHIKLMTDCATTDFTKVSEILTPTEEEKNWMIKNLNEIKENAGMLFESLSSWLNELIEKNGLE